VDLVGIGMKTLGRQLTEGASYCTAARVANTAGLRGAEKRLFQSDERGCKELWDEEGS